MITEGEKILSSAKWITDGKYSFKKKTSPAPFTFCKQFSTTKSIKKATVFATALGIYELSLNGKKVGDIYFAPGFTSYKHRLQYNEYDVTGEIRQNNEIVAVVGGGWAVGRFTYNSKSKITCDRQALLMALKIEYDDGKVEIVFTDESWKVSLDGNYRFCDFYDGETYDATVDLNKVVWRGVDIYKPKFKINLCKCDCPVVSHEVLQPIKSFTSDSGETIYDFGQNFAGVVKLKINGKFGQKVVIRHAEILQGGKLNFKSLRTAKATATYICRDGEQTYSPLMTYMGFRYISVFGAQNEDILSVRAIALYSDIEQIGSFSCSNEKLNRLQSNIVWSGKSNFVDIPTDCPQRDERLGWTGDISVFARTACYNFDMSKFLDKWLKDMLAEQGRGGGIPLVVPQQGVTMPPPLATACWGDSCIIVPYTLYMASGDKKILERQYPSMKKYLKAVKFWAGLFSVGKSNRRIWKWLFQFGDWCAPTGNVMDWMKRGNRIATCYYAYTSKIMAQVARILGNDDDGIKYEKLFSEICKAYVKKFCFKTGKLKKPFQTGYVLPLALGMVSGKIKTVMAFELNELVKNNGFRLDTGFTGTPFLLFALSDNGYSDTAYKLLLQENKPSWLYEINCGATTTWEQWAITDENGVVPNVENRKDIPSFNHYAYGCVGEFLYRRVLGLEQIEAGYKSFVVKPILGGGLNYAKGGTSSPYGKINVAWRIEEGKFLIDVTVPNDTTCTLYMPSGEKKELFGGDYNFTEEYYERV